MKVYLVFFDNVNSMGPVFRNIDDAKRYAVRETTKLNGQGIGNPVWEQNAYLPCVLDLKGTNTYITEKPVI